ncbi:MAG TPA: hypothetical protein ENK43_03760 [Planctomycetes bacterium]|nr:hypothetical protein [Planctomycetota bacterium]
MMNRKLLPLLLALAVSASVPAQKTPANATKHSDDATQRLAEAAVMTDHLQVVVTLKKGGAMHGVVKDGRMIEKRVRGGAYKELEEHKKSTVGAGLRLWFYDKLPGYLFVPWRQIESVRIVRRLSRADWAVYEAREKAAAKERVKSSTSAPTPRHRDTLSKSTQSPAGFSALTDPQKDLMKEYPPVEGYVPEKFAALQKAMVLEDAKVGGKDARWLAVYPDWLKAYRAYMSIPEPEAKKASAKPGPRPRISRKPVKKPAPKKEAAPKRLTRPVLPKRKSPASSSGRSRSLGS